VLPEVFLRGQLQKQQAISKVPDGSERIIAGNLRMSSEYFVGSEAILDPP